MTPKLFRSDETRQWLRHAREDLTGAEVLMTARSPLLKLALFHCQQAVEKALKGFLVWHEKSFARTHNLVSLGKQCMALDESLKDTVFHAVDLTQYAVRFRYPGEASEPTLEQARQCLEAARSVLDAVVQRLPEEVRNLP